MVLTWYAVCDILLFWLEGSDSLWEQMFAEFLCRKVYKNNCLNCLKIYVRIFIQCINISCRNFQIIQKTSVLYRFKSLNFSELKWKSVKRVFLYSAGISPTEMLKKFSKFFYLFFCEKMFLNFEILILKNFNWLKCESLFILF